MRPENKSPSDRAAKRGHFYELWSRRPLAGAIKNAANRLISRRLERRRLNRMAQQQCEIGAAHD
jgi:hypothetical protein